ncbi:cation-transporting P-type ATPase [Meiothermus sp. CFH 77666]|uniref:cation-transporting P-type ATPase n=1 Tax=Meiothermus sp. CFH 77666 TaxID=2817942 RepID=UPI001AA02E6E|nr:hypothetical protein [Meiothermus sp. CFH 77666]
MNKRGLSTQEAVNRLARYGPNTLPEQPPEPLWRHFLRQFRSPLIYTLVDSSGQCGVAAHPGSGTAAYRAGPDPLALGGLGSGSGSALVELGFCHAHGGLVTPS